MSLAFFEIIFGLAYLALWIAAVTSIARSRNYTSGVKVLWILAVIVVPFLGALVWFIWGRKATDLRTT